MDLQCMQQLNIIVNDKGILPGFPPGVGLYLHKQHTFQIHTFRINTSYMLDTTECNIGFQWI